MNGSFSRSDMFLFPKWYHFKVGQFYTYIEWDEYSKEVDDNSNLSSLTLCCVFSKWKKMVHNNVDYNVFYTKYKMSTLIFFKIFGYILKQGVNINHYNGSSMLDQRRNSKYTLQEMPREKKTVSIKFVRILHS